MSKHDVFVSYASQDKQIADAIVARLENRGVRCWYAPRDITGGASYAAAIVEAIRNARVFVLVLSTSSNDSSQVTNEVERAVHHERHILPFRIDPIQPSGDLEYFVSSRHWLDALPPPAKAHIERLVSTVTQVLQTSDEAPQDEGPGGDDPQEGSRLWLKMGVAAIVVLLAALGWFVRGLVSPADESTSTAAAEVPGASGDSGGSGAAREDTAAPDERRSPTPAEENGAEPEGPPSLPGPEKDDPAQETEADDAHAEPDTGPDTEPDKGPDMERAGPDVPAPSKVDPVGPSAEELPAGPVQPAAGIALDLAESDARELPPGWSAPESVEVYRDQGGLAFLRAPGTGAAESPRATIAGDFLARLELVHDAPGRVGWTLLGADGARDLHIDLNCAGARYSNAWKVKLPRASADHASAGATTPTLFQLERRGQVFRLYGDGALLATMRDADYESFEGVRIDFVEGALGVARCTLEESRPSARGVAQLAPGRVETASLPPGELPPGWTVDGEFGRPAQGTLGLTAASQARHRLVSPALALADEFLLELSTENTGRVELVLTLLGVTGERDLPLYFAGASASYGHVWNVGLPGAVRRKASGTGSSRLRVTRRGDSFRLHFDDQLVEAIPVVGLGRFRGFQLDLLDAELNVTEIEWRPLPSEPDSSAGMESENAGGAVDENRDEPVFLRLDSDRIGGLPAGWEADAAVALAPIEGMIGLHAAEAAPVESPEFELRGDSEVVFDLRHRSATGFQLTLVGDAGLPLVSLQMSNGGPRYGSRWSGRLGQAPFAQAGLEGSLVHTFQIVRRGGAFRFFVDGVPVAAALDETTAPLRRLQMNFGDSECWVVRLGAGPIAADDRPSETETYALSADAVAPGALPAGWISRGLHRGSPTGGVLAAATSDLERLVGPPVRFGDAAMLELSVRNTSAAWLRLTLLGVEGTPDVVVRLENSGQSYSWVWTVDLPDCSRAKTDARSRDTSHLRMELGGHLLRLSIDGEPVQACVLPHLGRYRGWILDTKGIDLGLQRLAVAPLASGPPERPSGARPGPLARWTEGDTPEGWAEPGAAAVTRSGGAAALRPVGAQAVELTREIDLSEEGSWVRVGLLPSAGSSLEARLGSTDGSDVTLKLEGGAARYQHAWKGTFGTAEVKFSGGAHYAPVLLQITRSGSELVLHADGAEVARTALEEAAIRKLEFELAEAGLGVLELTASSDERASTDALAGFEAKLTKLTWGALPEGWRAGDGVMKRSGSAGLGTVRAGWHRLESPPVHLSGDFAAQLSVRYTSSHFVVTCLTNGGVPVPIRFSNAGPNYQYVWTVQAPGAEPVKTGPGRSTGTSTLNLVRRGDELEVWIDSEQVVTCSVSDLGPVEGLRFDFGDEVTELSNARLSSLD